MSRAQQLLDLSRQIRPDARQRIELLGPVHFLKFARQTTHDPGRAPISADSKRILSLWISRGSAISSKAEATSSL